MAFDSMVYFENPILKKDERDADLHAQIEFELGLLPDSLRGFWEKVFDEDPELYPPQVQLDTIRRVRDVREGKSFLQKGEKIRNAEVRSTELSHQQIQAAFAEAIAAYQSREVFLGNGATAEVFGLPDALNICVKVITDHHAYQNGGNNTLQKEVDFLQKVQDLEVQGVRAPKFYFHIENPTVHAYCMERLDAMNMSHVLTGLVSMREMMEVNADVFGDALLNYVIEMHERGIAHNDLAPRNVMIDKNTLMPRVIDFGKSKDLSMFNEGDQSEFIARDLRSVEALRDFIKGYQSGVRYKFGG